MPLNTRRPPAALLAPAGGLLAALSFEPVGWGFLTPAAMGLLWLAVAPTPQIRWRVVFVRGLSFGMTFMAALLWWLVDSIGWVPWVLLTVTQALAVSIAAVAVAAARRLPAGPVWAGALWAVVEGIRSAWPLGGIPWGRLGVTAVDTPWEELLPYCGISGTGFVLAVGGFALGGLVGRSGTWRVPIMVTILAAVAASSLAPFRAETAASYRVAVVQGGVPGDGRDLARHHREVTDNHVEQTLAVAQRSATNRAEPKLDLVLWPENSTAVDPLRDQTARTGINRAVAAVGVPTLVGGIFDGPDDTTAYNRGLVWLPDKTVDASYTKMHPVPFGEYIPWRSIIGNWSSRFELIPRDFVAGDDEGPLDIDGILVANAICFDVAYDDVLPDQVRRGAQLVTVQTSNATFFGTSQPGQQFEITRARAVELRRGVAVASTKGVSGVIGPTGDVVARLPPGPGSAVVASVPLSDTLTPAVRWQSLREHLLALLAIAGVLGCAIRSRRDRARTRETVGPVPGAVAPGAPDPDQESGKDDQRKVSKRPPE